MIPGGCGQTRHVGAVGSAGAGRCVRINFSDQAQVEAIGGCVLSRAGGRGLDEAVTLQGVAGEAARAGARRNLAVGFTGRQGSSSDVAMRQIHRSGEREQIAVRRGFEIYPKLRSARISGRSCVPSQSSPREGCGALMPPPRELDRHCACLHSGLLFCAASTQDQTCPRPYSSAVTRANTFS